MADSNHTERRINSWSELFARTMEVGLGAVSLTADTAQRLVNDLVHRGEVASEESASLVDRLTQMGREQRESLVDMVEKGSERAMVRMDLTRRSDLEALRLRVAALEQAVLGQAPIEEPIQPIRSGDPDMYIDQE